MNMKAHLLQAIANLSSAKLRSFLAVLGILVGTASVVALVSGGELATRQALAQFKDLGTDLMSVGLYQKQPGKSTPRNTLALKDAMALSSQTTGIRKVAPYLRVYYPTYYHGQKLDARIIGTVGTLRDIIKIKMQTGRFISWLDGYQNFCVIGQSLYQKMRRMDIQSPIGQQLRVGDQIFTIVGIAKNWPENAFFNENINDAIIVPLKSAEMLGQNIKITSMVFQLAPNVNLAALKSNVRQTLQLAVPELQLFFRSAKGLIASMKKQGQIFTLLLGLIGGISLLVGGIGVMNVMLVSVTERRREIGIRKALGARRQDILRLFLMEAVILALFGGLCGVLIGLLISRIIAYFAHWAFALFWLPPLVGFVVSAATGVFFGFYPAYRASKLDPIATLRYE
jgi:putative ABC transport system permease protein